MAITQKSRWDDAGVEPPAGSAKYTAGEQPIAEYDNWFNKAVVDDIAALNSWLDNLGITKIYIDTEANMPASGTTKELFIATDTNKIYRGTGTGWQLLTTEWDAILNKPSSFPPSVHASSHAYGGSDQLSLDASQITSGRLSLSRLPTSATANRYLVVRTANADPVWDVIKLSDLSIDTDKFWNRKKITGLGGLEVIATASFPPGQGGLIAWNYPSGSGATVFFNHHGTGHNEYIFYSTTDWSNFTELLRITNSNAQFNVHILPKTNNTYDLGSSSLRFKDIYLAGSIHFGDGTTLSSASGLTGKTLYAADETEVSTTSTTPTSVKQFNLVKLAGAGLNWNTLTVVLEAYNTAGQTTNVDIVIGGTTYATLSWTENAYALKYTTIDISGLGDGKYLVDFKMYVTGGTGYLQHMEVWVE